MAEFDFSTLITDRAQADLSELKTLLSKQMEDWTEAEQAWFNEASSKGAYNYTDLNRVTTALEYLDETLRSYGYTTGYQRLSVPHIDGTSSYTWTESDIPTPSLMAAYLANVLGVYTVLMAAPELPETMEKLTYTGANQIEQALVTLNEAIEHIVAGFARANSFAFWSGNRPFPTAISDRGRNWAELDAMGTSWKNWQVADWYLLLYGNMTAEGVVT